MSIVKSKVSCGKQFRRAALFAGCAVAALSASQGALAQSAEPGDAVTVEEIIVTAQRRSERLEEVPQAVVALTTESLERANVVNIHELGRVAPGVQINFGGLSTQPAIRGVSSLTAGTGNENNVATYVDGFYVPDNTSINSDMANLESIQVLKGPQGTLYGRNATGGAILINTMRPSSEFTGRVEGAYGSFNERRASGYVSGPLGDRARLLVAGSVRDSDGHIRLSDPTDVTRDRGNAAPQEQRALRTKLELDVASNLTATLAYNYAFSSDASGLMFTPFDYVPSSLPGGNARANRFGTASYNHEAIASTETQEYTMKLEWVTPVGTLTSYTGYADRHHEVYRDSDGTYVDLSYGTTFADQTTFQQSVDFVVDTFDRVDLVVGAFYLKDDNQIRHEIFGPNLTLNQLWGRPLKTEAYAFYADANIKLTDRLSFGIGGRYSYDDRWVSQTTLNGSGSVLVPFFEAQADFDGFTPRATLRYEIAPRSNIYASYSQGFRAGSFNSAPTGSAALNLPIAPEEITAYEVGFKTVQSKFRFEASAFYYDYQNMNVSLTIPSPLCAGQPVCQTVTVIGSAPEAEIYGLDGLLTYSPTERLNFSIGGAWLHARYGDFPNAIGTGVNAAMTGNITSQVQDWSGQQLARAPDFSGQLSVDYTWPLWEGELRLATNVAYSTGYAISNPSLYGPLAPANLRGEQRYRQDDTTLINGDLTWTDPSQQYWVAVYVKNLADETYRLTYNGGASGDYSTKAAPRTYGVRLGYKF